MNFVQYNFKSFSFSSFALSDIDDVAALIFHEKIMSYKLVKLRTTRERRVESEYVQISYLVKF